jgi:hypothetical protein
MNWPQKVRICLSQIVAGRTLVWGQSFGNCQWIYCGNPRVLDLASSCAQSRNACCASETGSPPTRVNVYSFIYLRAPSRSRRIPSICGLGISAASVIQSSDSNPQLPRRKPRNGIRDSWWRQQTATVHISPLPSSFQTSQKAIRDPLIKSPHDSFRPATNFEFPVVSRTNFQNDASSHLTNI